MNLLVMRFSAMGDVALLAPALIAISANYPNVQITLVTRGNFTPFFFNMPNVNVIGINLKKYKGIVGIWKFYKELEKLGPYDKIIDLHSSLRSRAFSFIYRLRGIPTFTINKGRKEKNEQIKRKNKVLKNLPHTVERYLKVFEHAGFPAVTRRGPWINVDADSKIYAQDFFKRMGLKKKETLWVGFAPFAGHELKEWPMYKSILLVKQIQTEFNACIFLFGSTEERKKLKVIQGDLENCFIVSGDKMGIRGELGIMEKLDLMIGMDSSNIHLMALLKKPVIGIFGTTHPYSGFGPYGQEDSGVLQVEHLPCRPCSIYGNTTCYRKDFACMEMIDPADVIKRIRFVLNVNTLW